MFFKYFNFYFELIYSIPSSDDETLSYWTEEEVQTRQHVPNLRPRPPTIGSTFSTLKNHSGKKKFRRYHNGKFNFTKNSIFIVKILYKIIYFFKISTLIRTGLFLLSFLFYSKTFFFKCSISKY